MPLFSHDGITITPIHFCENQGGFNYQIDPNQVDLNIPFVLKYKLVGSAVYTYFETSSYTGSKLVSQPGVYEILIPTSDVCLESFIIEILASQIEINVTILPSCENENSGSISVVTNGGHEPLSILWSDGNTEFTRYNIPVGAYYAEIKDAIGCSKVVNAVVEEVACPCIAFLPPIEITSACNHDGAIELTWPATGYNFYVSWTGTREFTNLYEHGIVNAEAGVYTATYENQECIISRTYVVPLACTRCLSDPLPLVEINPSCGTGANNGGILLTWPNQPNGDYYVDWSGTGPFTNNHENGISEAAPGEYMATFYDDHDCIITRNYKIVNIIDYEIIEFNNPSCVSGFPNNGNITLEVQTYQNSSYNITWYESYFGYPIGFPIGYGSQIDGLGPNEYVAIIETEGCTIMRPFRLTCCFEYDRECRCYISKLPKPKVENVEIKYVSQTGACDGAITYTVSGLGYGGTIKLVKMPENMQINSLAMLCEGEYCIILNNGCDIVTECFTVGSCSDVDISLNGIITPTCPGANFGAISTQTDQNFGPFSYIWSNGSTNANLTNLAMGNYTVTVTDKYACKHNKSFSILPSNPLIQIENGICTFVSTCNGHNVPGTERTGNYSFEFDRTDCSKTTICMDDFFPTGEKEYPKIDLEVYLTTDFTIQDENGCYNKSLYCVGPDEERGGGDDTYFKPLDLESKIKVVASWPDVATNNCLECHSAKVCKYTIEGILIEGESTVSNKSFDIYTDYEPYVIPGINYCNNSSDGEGCFLDIYCPYLKNINGNIYPFDHICLPLWICSLDPIWDKDRIKEKVDIILESYFDGCDFPTDQMFLDGIDKPFKGINESDNREKELLTTTTIIYPNPFTESFSLRLDPTVEFGKIFIFNSEGKMIPSEITEIDTNYFEIKLQPEISGMLFIRIISKNGEIYINKIIKI